MHPDIICITESLPKNTTRSTLDSNTEYAIEGYNMYQGKYPKRGVIMYIAGQLHSTRVDELTDHQHEEQIWCSVKTVGGKTVLIGNIYHSPSSTHENYENLIRCINESGRLGYDNLIIVGDFNMPNIDWDTWNGRSEKKDL